MMTEEQLKTQTDERVKAIRELETMTRIIDGYQTAIKNLCDCVDVLDDVQWRMTTSCLNRISLDFYSVSRQIRHWSYCK